jgi:hypothetical protein
MEISISLRNETQDFVYTNSSNVLITPRFLMCPLQRSSNNIKINLPYKIDWQTNASYRPESSAQGNV